MIHIAARLNAADLMANILNHSNHCGENINSRVICLIDQEGGCTALHIASQHGFIDIVKLLINQKDIDKEAIDIEYMATPLLWAVWSGKLEVTKFLIKNGCNVKARDSYGANSLVIAVIYGHLKIVEYISDSELIPIKSLNSRFETNTCTCHPLIVAVFVGDLKMVQWLFTQTEVLKEPQDDNGETPLFFAVKNNHSKIVEFLLQQDINTEPIDEAGRTPLYYAKKMGLEEIIKVFRQYLILTEEEHLEKEMIEERKKQRKVIIGSTVGCFLTLIFFIVLGFYFWRTRRVNLQKRTNHQFGTTEMVLLENPTYLQIPEEHDSFECTLQNYEHNEEDNDEMNRDQAETNEIADDSKLFVPTNLIGQITIVKLIGMYLLRCGHIFAGG